ncbi:MAG: hypothetical protein HFJ80_02255 [Clostridiales bacterium]|nr:hypothetical protein [Clostridiales bacterium]
MNEDVLIMQMVTAMFVWLFLIMLAGLASSVMLGLCVYNDARYRGDTNAVLWGVLSGFFNIAALVYLIVKLASKRFLYCSQCGQPLSCAEPVCQCCGAVSPEVHRFSPPEQREKQKRSRLVFLWLFIGLTVLSVIFGFVMMIQMISSIPYAYLA